MENIYLYFIGIVIIGFLIYLFMKLFRKYTRVTPTIIDPFMFYDKVKNGYTTLSNTLYHNCNKNDLEEDLKKTLRERADGRYLGGYTKESNEFDFISFSLDSFYDLLEYGSKRNQSMILDLNKGISLEKLNDFFLTSLDNKLEDKSFIRNDTKNSTFPYSTLLSRYQRVLNENLIQIGLFRDSSDSCYLFIFPLSKEKIVENAIIDIGFKYEVVPKKQDIILTSKYEQKKAFT